MTRNTYFYPSTNQPWESESFSLGYASSILAVSGSHLISCFAILILHSMTLPSRRKSQIQTYLEQNEGPGLQHLALKTKDIFETIELMRQSEEELGGFELMKRPSDQYYRELPDRLGDQLTVRQQLRIKRYLSHYFALFSHCFSKLLHVVSMPL